MPDTDFSADTDQLKGLLGLAPPPAPAAAAPADPDTARLNALLGRPEWGDAGVPTEARLTSFVASHAAGGSSHEEFDRDARHYFPGLDTDRLHQDFGLAQARAKLAGKEESSGEYAERRMIPGWSDVRAFRYERAYNRAVEAFNQGKATPGDMDTIALVEQRRQKDQGYGSGDYLTALGHNLATIPAVAAEMYGAGPVLRGAAAVGTRQVVAGGRAAAPSVLGRAATTGLVAPVVAPSMGFYQGAAQRQGQNGGDLLDWKNAAPAYALSATNAAVLGTVQSVLKGAGPFVRIPGSGAIGAGEKMVADVATSALGLTTGYGAVGKLLKGDAGEALREASIDFLTFSAFAALHRGQPPGEEPGAALVPAERPDPKALPAGPETRVATPGGEPGPGGRPPEGVRERLVRTFTDAVNHLHERGYGPDEAGRALRNVKARLDWALRTNPELVRDDARRVFEGDPDGPLKDLGLAFADTFQVTRPPAPRQLPPGVADVSARPMGGDQPGPGEPPAGHVRLYHGGLDPTTGGGRWVSPDAKYAEGYARKTGSPVSYIDLPADHPLVEANRDSAFGPGDPRNPINHFELPPDLARKLRPLDVPAGQPPAGPEASADPRQRAADLESQWRQHNATMAAAERAVAVHQERAGLSYPDSPDGRAAKARADEALAAAKKTRAGVKKALEATRRELVAARDELMRQPAAPKPGEPTGTEPAPAPGGKLPPFIQEAVDRGYAAGEKAGVVGDILDMAARGMTRKEIAARIKDRLPAAPGEDVPGDVIRAVRVKHSVPSADAGAEFTAWRDKYLAAKAGTAPQSHAVAPGRPIPPPAGPEPGPAAEGRAAAPGGPPRPEPARVLPDVLAAAGLGERVDRATSEQMSREVGGELSVLDFGDRFVSLHKLPGANRVAIDFGYAEGKPGETAAVAPMLQKGTVELLRDLGRVAGALREKGLGVEFSAEDRRAGLYAKALQRAGFKPVASPDPGRYVFEPAGPPAGKPAAPPAAAPPAPLLDRLRASRAAADPLSVLTAKDVAALARKVGVPALGPPGMVYARVAAAPGGQEAIARLVRFKTGTQPATAKPQVRPTGMNPADVPDPAALSVGAGEQTRAGKKFEVLEALAADRPAEPVVPQPGKGRFPEARSLLARAGRQAAGLRLLRSGWFDNVFPDQPAPHPETRPGPLPDPGETLRNRVLSARVQALKAAVKSADPARVEQAAAGVAELARLRGQDPEAMLDGLPGTTKQLVLLHLDRRTPPAEATPAGLARAEAEAEALTRALKESLRGDARPHPLARPHDPGDLAAELGAGLEAAAGPDANPADAASVVRAATAGVGGPAGGAGHPLAVRPGGPAGDARPGGGLTGTETRITTPTGGVPARYEVRDLATVRASHQALPGGGIRSREKAGEYPPGLQPRDYAPNGSEHLKVLKGARELQPGYFVSAHPDATSGPPAITRDGTVLNGNGRQMMLEAAAHAPAHYAKYKAELVRQAASYGIDPKAVAGMDRPALYRVVDMAPTSPEAKAFARAGNVATTQSQSPVRTAASLGHLIDPQVIDSLKLEGDTTFSEAVTDPAGGKAFRDKLRAELPPSEVDRYFTPDGRLTDAGTEFARNMLLTKLLPPPLVERLGEDAKAVKRTLEGALPQLLKLRRDFPQHDPTGPLTEALTVLSDHPNIRTARDADNLLSQGDLFTGGKAVPVSPAGRMMLDTVLNDGMKPLVFRRKMAALVNDLEQGTNGLFAEPTLDTAQIAADALGVQKRAGAEFGPAARYMKAAVDFLKGESGHFLFPSKEAFRDAARQAAERFAGAVRYVNARLDNLGGVIAPNVQRLSSKAADSIARFIKAAVFVRQAAPLLTEKVMGDLGNTAESRRLWGAVFSEARLRYMRDAYLDKSIHADQEALDAKARGDRAAEADAKARSADYRKQAKEVITLVGPDSPVKTEAEYAARVGSEEFRGLLDRWRQHMVPEMDRNFRAAQGLEDTDPINAETQIPGHPINLKGVRKGDVVGEGAVFAGGVKPGANGEAATPGGPQRGNLTNPRQRLFMFGRKATGAAAGYETDLGDIIGHSLGHGHPRAAKAEMYRTLVREKVARWGKPGQAAEGERELPRVDAPQGTQDAKPGETSLYVKEPAYSEVRQALEVDEPANWMKAAAAVNGVLTKASLLSTVEAAYHTKNLLTFLAKAGVRPIRDMLPNLYRVMSNDGGTLQKLVDLAGLPRGRDRRADLVDLSRIGATKDMHGFESGLLWGGKTDPTTYAGRFLDLVDRAARLTALDAFKRLEGRTNPVTGKPLIVSGEGALRDFVNQLGQYGRAGQDKAVVWLRDTGFGPFATAGANYAVQGLRTLTGNSGVRAAHWTGEVMLRAETIAKAAALAALAKVLNYALHGRHDGDDSTPFGALKVGEKNGKTEYLDLASLSGLTRGMRETGLLAVTEGVRAGKPAGATADRAVEEVWHSLLHPAVGPGVGFGYMAATGRNTLGVKVADKPAAEDSQAWENLMAAVRNANPPFATLSGYNKAPAKGEGVHPVYDLEGRPAATVTTEERLHGLLGPFGKKFRTQRSFEEQAALEEKARKGPFGKR